MNDFGYYIGEGKVKKQATDADLALSLRKKLVKRAEKTLKLDRKEYDSMVFENIYDVFRELCDAILALDGYKSYSHEASISYLRKYDVEDSVLVELDDFRFKRNSSKYYGKEIFFEDAEEIIRFYDKHFKRLLSILDKKLNKEKMKW